MFKGALRTDDKALKTLNADRFNRLVRKTIEDEKIAISRAAGFMRISVACFYSANVSVN